MTILFSENLQQETPFLGYAVNEGNLSFWGTLTEFFPRGKAESWLQAALDNLEVISLS